MTYEPTARDRSYWFTEDRELEAVAVEVVEAFNFYQLVIPVGTRAVTVPRTRMNAGFNGILVSLVLADGTKVHGVSAGKLRAVGA